MKRVDGGLLHGVAAADRAGEGDEADSRVARSTRATWSWSRCRNWKTPSGRPAALNALGVALGDQRRLRRHFEDHRVAGEQRRHDRVHRREPGIVPRRDHQHDAERLAPDEAAGILPFLPREYLRETPLRWRPCKQPARRSRGGSRRGSARPGGPSARRAPCRARRRARRTRPPCAGRSRRARRRARFSSVAGPLPLLRVKNQSSGRRPVRARRRAIRRQG